MAFQKRITQRRQAEQVMIAPIEEKRASPTDQLAVLPKKAARSSSTALSDKEMIKIMWNSYATRPSQAYSQGSPGGAIHSYEMSSSSKGVLVGIFSSIAAIIIISSAFALLYFFRYTSRGRILLDRMGRPGEFDDEQSFLREEAEWLEAMDERTRQEYFRAKAFVTSNPPESMQTDISLSQFMAIQEKGVSAWEFEPEMEIANCFVEQRTEIEFFDSECSVQSNLPIPKQNEVYYWEAKMYDKPESTTISIGVATKPYPMFRLPGWHRHSVAYVSEGSRRYNQPFYGFPYGPVYEQGDVVGCGYRPRTGTIFFTRNGKKLEDVAHGLKTQNFFPTIGATGPCHIQVNLGQMGFVFIEANVKKWGLAPMIGSLAPPPAYGNEDDSILLDSGKAGVREGQGPMFAAHYGNFQSNIGMLGSHARSLSAQLRFSRKPLPSAGISQQGGLMSPDLGQSRSHDNISLGRLNSIANAIKSGKVPADATDLQHQFGTFQSNLAGASSPATAAAIASIANAQLAQQHRRQASYHQQYKEYQAHIQGSSSSSTPPPFSTTFVPQPSIPEPSIALPPNNQNALSISTPSSHAFGPQSQSTIISSERPYGQQTHLQPRPPNIILEPETPPPAYESPSGDEDSPPVTPRSHNRHHISTPNRNNPSQRHDNGLNDDEFTPRANSIDHHVSLTQQQLTRTSSHRGSPQRQEEEGEEEEDQVPSYESVMTVNTTSPRPNQNMDPGRRERERYWGLRRTGTGTSRSGVGNNDDDESRQGLLSESPNNDTTHEHDHAGEEDDVD